MPSSPDNEMCCDLPGQPTNHIPFDIIQVRESPDLVVINSNRTGSQIWMLEHIVCFESNTFKGRPEDCVVNCVHT